MKLFRRVGALALCALLLLPGRALATEEHAYPDLPAGHWAYASMDRAVGLGLLSGMGGGYMAPDGTLTWGQYLVMLDRAFCPERYAGALTAGLSWDTAGYWTALDEGLILPDDFLPVTHHTLSSPILRREAAVLLSRVLPGEDSAAALSPDAQPFADWQDLPAGYREGVTALRAAGIAKGRLDGTFDGGAQMARADGTVLLLRTLDYIEALWASQEPEEPILPIEDAPPASVPETTGGGDLWADRPLLREQWENAEKSLLLFDDPYALRFDSREEAEERMVTVEVPVWKLKNGEKYESKLSVAVHQAIADEVAAIFTEIFNDPERFPIYDLGGYQWRGDSATGEHNTGTAIDINAWENYQVKDDVSMAGGYWTPYEDPYSIPEGGSVVRIFKAHGWSWGGDAWVEFRPGYHDYMHFSYMGR